jgi:hypothetical protein
MEQVSFFIELLPSGIVAATINLFHEARQRTSDKHSTSILGEFDQLAFKNHGGHRCAVVNIVSYHRKNEMPARQASNALWAMATSENISTSNEQTAFSFLCSLLKTYSSEPSESAHRT